MTFIDIEKIERLDSQPAAGLFDMHRGDVFIEEPICQHCAHWATSEAQEEIGWGYCTAKLWNGKEDGGQVGETGPRFGCVHFVLTNVERAGSNETE